MPMPEQPPEPWLSFFREVDRQATETIHLHCFGGFVMTQMYGIARTTSDVDFVSLAPNKMRTWLAETGGQRSELHKQYGVYLDPVTVVVPPTHYESRLRPLFPQTWNHLFLYALEAHDLALCKLERNLDRDREDVQHLARSGHLNRATLTDRYQNEFRPNLFGRLEWHDQTLQLWIDLCWPADSVANSGLEPSSGQGVDVQ
jgi:hypothetical protein